MGETKAGSKGETEDSISWTITDNTRQIDAEVRQGIQQAHRNLLRQTEALARDRAPVDTGQLRSSIHIDSSSLYSAKGLEFGVIVVDATYGVFVHEGFWHILAGRQIPGRPFLRNAAAEAWAGFMRECQQVFRAALQ